MINNNLPKNQLFKLMQSGAMVITPNNRLSSELLNEFLKANPKSVQDKPLCLPYSAFLQRCLNALCYSEPFKSHPFVLSTQQSRYLFGQIIAQSTSKLINEGLLAAIEEAWARCHLWQIDFNHQAFSYTAQTRQFQLWAQSFLKTLHKMNALTEHQLASYLVTQKYCYPYQTLVWACFDDYSPEQLSLQHYFNEQGCTTLHYDLCTQPSTLSCYAAKDGNDEYQQLVYWLKEQLSANEKRIAIVVPELQNQAQGLKRFLQQHLPATFNISLGQSLVDYPLVAHAFCWLGLHKEQLTVSEARLLLHSPFLAYSQTEMLARAQFSEENKILQELEFPLPSFLSELENSVPKLADLLGKMAKYPDKDSPQGWINHFTNRLIHLGFPGDYALNSASFQCYQRFLSLFDEFKQLALVCAEMTSTEAYFALKNLAKTAIFQAKNEEASIQVLGLLEAAGCTFDSLWISGLTDQCLPQKPKLSAFIPIALQRDNLMPHASPARELMLAEKALTRLANSSPRVVFSYPLLSEDKPNMPSPLIAGFPPFPAYTIRQNKVESTLVEFTESYQLPFGEHEKISGGTAILANQAKCPFRAFAAHRLYSKATLETSDGPDARERGQLVHKVMELLWRTLQNQETLLSLDERQLDQVIEKAIQQALEPLIQQRTFSFSSLLQEVELTKLRRLVHACLDWERQRPAFEVEALEQAFTINLATIDFNLRVDRLDRLKDGYKWVIDYKSSLPSSMPWKEERPREPQLILYALLDESINGLLFAQLKAGQISLKGLTEEEHLLPGLNAIKKEEHWSDYRKLWQSRLTELASEFGQGYCPPQPATSAICQTCEFKHLCRFNS